MLGLLILCLTAFASAAPQYSYDQSGSIGAASGVGLSSLASIGGLQPIYNKQFYIHSAPDDDLDSESASQLNSLLRRNLRVVFIKSPENKGLENAALQLAKAAGEDRTAIYVLNKQTDLADLHNKLSQIQDPNASKPEVHFVKYKTHQEAEHAQHTIQAQYDQLGGPSQVLNEGIAPVRNFIGSLGALQSLSATGGGGVLRTGGGGGNAAVAAAAAGGYLPPQYRH